VDCEPDTGLIDLDAAEAAITPRTKAIMPVHLAGRPVDMERLADLRDRHGLTIVEDAAHAIGARWRRRAVGSFGNLTAFSFYVTKNITTTEGGALATTDPAMAARVEQLALHGLSLGAWHRYSDHGFKHYEATELGFKFNMTDIQAALGIHQLPKLDEWIDCRAHQWQRYDRELADLPLLTPPPATADMRHAHHLYQLRTSADCPLSRDEILEELHVLKIGGGVHYRGVHLHPYYRDKYGLVPERFPAATAISDTTFSIPLSPKVSERDQDDVIAALHQVLGR
jgi:dTDP-4-amino-4,6-dideoxygalactose transaminase